MPHIQVGKANIYYEIHGDGPETVVFSHGLLWSGKMFGAQVEALKGKYRVVVYDHPGQGKSTTTGRLDMESLYEDAVGMIETLGLAPCHFAGLSMGGFIGMRLAARRADLLKSLLLLETSALNEPYKIKYLLLNTIVKFFGIPAVSDKVMNIMFGHTFMTDPSRSQERSYWKGQLEANQKSITKAVTGVIFRNDIAGELSQITLPTLVVVGDEDVATTPEKAHFLHKSIKGSQLVIIPQAGHSSCIEQPEKVNQAIQSFLENIV